MQDFSFKRDVKKLHSQCPFICVAVTCPPPPVVANAQSTGSAVTVGSTVSYQCNQCFRGSAVLTCQSTGTWQPQAPVCQREYRVLLRLRLGKICVQVRKSSDYEWWNIKKVVSSCSLVIHSVFSDTTSF